MGVLGLGTASAAPGWFSFEVDPKNAVLPSTDSVSSFYDLNSNNNLNKHTGLFTLSRNLSRWGLFQKSPPTEGEIKGCVAWPYEGHVA